MDQEEPVWIGRNMNVPGAEETTWLSKENIVGYGDDYVQSETKHPMHVFCDVLLAASKGRTKSMNRTCSRARFTECNLIP